MFLSEKAPNGALSYDDLLVVRGLAPAVNKIIPTDFSRPVGIYYSL